MYKLSFIAAGMFFISCGTSTNGDGNVLNATGDTTLKPVETKSPNTDYKPALAGQTRVAGVKTTTPYQSAVITEALSKPWGITQMPDGRLLVTQKGGSMVIVSATGQVSQPIAGIPEVDAADQGGLLGITLDPQFNTNRMVYWTFSERVPAGNHTSVAKGKLSADDKTMENVSVIYRATPAYNGDKHYGSRILVDKTGNLVVSTGERSDLETRPQAQDLNSALGKVIRITKDGKPAEGNPFLNKAGARPEIYSYGHRNVQGLAFHPQTGDLWESEMGPRGGDELNRVEAGKNYGWPTITYGIEYGGQKIGGGITKQDGLEQPVYYWDPVLSPSGMTFYTSDAIPEWKNNVFICGLSSNHIARLVLENNRVVGEERILPNEKQRFRDICMGANGEMYTITDGGKLYRITKK